MTNPMMRTAVRAGARRIRRTVILAIIALLGSLATAQTKPEMPVDLHLAWHASVEGRLQADISIAGRTVTLGAEPTRVLVPPGEHAWTILTPGLRAVSPVTVRLSNPSDGGVPTVTLIVAPKVELAAPNEVLIEAGRVSFDVTLTTTYPGVIATVLEALDAPGVQYRLAQRVRGVARAGLATTLRLVADVDEGVEAITVRAEPGASTTTVRVISERQPGWHVADGDAPITVRRGAERTTSLTIRNDADAAAIDVHVEAEASEGLEIRVTPDRWRLAPGGTHTFDVRVTNRGEVPGDPKIVLTALGSDGERVRIERPVTVSDVPVDVTLEATPGTRLPGEALRLTTHMVNEGDEAYVYRLRWSAPEWFETDAALDESGVVPAGETVTMVLDGRVAFGPPGAGEATVSVAIDAVDLQAVTVLERSLLDVTWDTGGVAPSPGDPAQARVRLGNPRDEVLDVIATFATSAGVTVDGGATQSWTVPPGRSERLVTWRADAPGDAWLELLVTAGGRPVAHRAAWEASVRARPTVEARTGIERSVDVAFPVDAVLVRQALPAGVRIAPSTTRVDGVGYDDPFVAGDGAAWWRMDGLEMSSLDLSYEVRHDVRAVAVPDAEVAVIIGGSITWLTGRPPEGGVPSGLTTLRVRVEDVMAPPDRTGDASNVGVGRFRVLEPAGDVAMRSDEAMRVVVEHPREGALGVTVNGEVVPDHRVGLRGFDAERGVERVEYYGLNLLPGVNVVRVTHGDEVVERTVRLAGAPDAVRFSVLGALLEGENEVTLAVEIVDEAGIPVGFGPVTVTSDLEIVTPDADLERFGHQIVVRDGRATLTLRVAPSDTHATLAARYENVEGQSRVPFARPTRSFAMGQASMSATLAPGEADVALDVRGLLEYRGGDGMAQLRVDAGIATRTGDGVRYRAGLEPSAVARYPVTGVAGDEGSGIRSDDGFAFVFEGDDVRFAYEFAPVDAGAIGVDVDGSALRARYRIGAGSEIDAAIGAFSLDRIDVSIIPDGTRRYALDARPARGSERVVVQWFEDGVLMEDRRLVAVRDYVLDAVDGAVILARPLRPTDLDGRTVRLLVQYAPLDAERTVTGYAATWRFGADAWSGSVSAARLPEGDALVDAVGARVAYDGPGVSANLAVERRVLEARLRARAEVRIDRGGVRSLIVAETGLEDRVAWEATFRPDRLPVTFAADVMAVRELPVEGSFEARAELDAATRLRARFERVDARDATIVVVERQLLPRGDALGIDVELGWRQDWTLGIPSLVTSVDVDGEGLTARVQHEHALSPSGDRRSRAEWVAPLVAGELRATVGYDWRSAAPEVGLGIDGVRLGPVAADVQVRRVAGEAAVLSTALRLPVSSTDDVDATLGVSLDRTLGESGDWFAALNGDVAVTRETLTVRVGSDLSWQPERVRLVADGSVQWIIDDRNVVGAELRGDLLAPVDVRLTAGWAHHGANLSILAHQRSAWQPAGRHEGELVAAWRPPFAQVVSLHPSVAYRWSEPTVESLVAQVGLTVRADLDAGFAVGGSAFGAWAGATGRIDPAFGVSLAYALGPAVDLVVGYTVGAGPNLVDGGSPGVHLRLDWMGGPHATR